MAHALWGFSIRTDLPSDQAHNANPTWSLQHCYLCVLPSPGIFQKLSYLQQYV